MANRKSETRVVGDNKTHVRTEEEVSRLQNASFRTEKAKVSTHKQKRKTLATLQKEIYSLKNRSKNFQRENTEDASSNTISNKEIETAKATAQSSAKYATQVAEKKAKQLLNDKKTSSTKASTTKRASQTASTTKKGKALLNQTAKKAEKETTRKSVEAVASTNTVTRVAMLAGKTASTVKSFISFNWLQKAEEAGPSFASNSSPVILAVGIILIVILSISISIPALPVILASALGEEDTTPGKIGVSANRSNEGYGSKNIYSSPQCTWYCWGRVYEVYGIEMARGGNGGDWYNNLKGTYKTYSVSDIAKNPEMAVGTVVSIKGGSTVLSRKYGHCVFVEKVEFGRIYYSDWGSTYQLKGVSFPHSGSFSVGTSSACGGTIQGFIAPTKPLGG